MAVALAPLAPIAWPAVAMFGLSAGASYMFYNLCIQSLEAYEKSGCGERKITFPCSIRMLIVSSQCISAAGTGIASAGTALGPEKAKKLFELFIQKSTTKE